MSDAKPTFHIFSLPELEAAVFAGSNATGWCGTEDMGNECVALRAAFVSALREQGFFYLKDIDVDEAECAEFDRLTHAGMDAEQVDTASTQSKGKVMRGYAPLGAESVARVMGKGTECDLCEKFTAGSDEALGENVWPTAEMRIVWDAYRARICSAARRLLALIGRMLELDSHERWAALLQGEQRFRHLRYPDVPLDRCSPEGADSTPSERLAGHNDLDTITLLRQTPCPNGFVSLQAYVHGEWIDVPAIQGTVVVNFGEVLSILTGGAVKATKHRVIAPPPSLRVGSSRTSTVCFFEPPADFPVRPLDETVFGDYFAGNCKEDRPFGEWLYGAIGKLTSVPEESSQDAQYPQSS